MSHQLAACPVAKHFIPASSCFFGRGDQSTRELWFYVWVVRGDNTIGLIDSGLPAEPEDLAALRTSGTYTDVVPLADVLTAQGLSPTDIDWCVLTQLVTYHTGGLNAANLPRATVYLALDGLTELLTDPPGHPAAEFYFTDSAWSFLRQLAIDGRLRAVDRPVDVVPGVRFEPTGGHHPGSAGVKVDTADGLVGILETAFVQENIDNEIPIGLAEDTARCRRVIRQWKKDCGIVIADHDPSATQPYPPR
jgi:glyoxylase-like metal-dependent hydrolase (beta-lactamase superfamily II)